MHKILILVLALFTTGCLSNGIMTVEHIYDPMVGSLEVYLTENTAIIPNDVTIESVSGSDWVQLGTDGFDTTVFEADYNDGSVDYLEESVTWSTEDKPVDEADYIIFGYVPGVGDGDACYMTGENPLVTFAIHTMMIGCTSYEDEQTTDDGGFEDPHDGGGDDRYPQGGGPRVPRVSNGI